MVWHFWTKLGQKAKITTGPKMIKRGRDIYDGDLFCSIYLLALQLTEVQLVYIYTILYYYIYVMRSVA